MSRLSRAAAAGALGVLLGGLVLPLASLALEARPGLRPHCTCDERGAAATPAPLRLDALLPAAPTPLPPRAGRLPADPSLAGPSERSDPPPLPPPRPPVPA
jgi:hypothetical protein